MKTNKPVPMHAATWYRTSLALGLTTLALVSLLQGCGGQSGGTYLTDGEIKRNLILANAPGGPTKLAGLYKGTPIIPGAVSMDANDEYLIFVNPDPSPSTNIQAYVWHRYLTQTPFPVAHIYYGAIEPRTDGRAVGDTWFANEGALNSPATIKITGASPTALIAAISVSRSNNTLATSTVIANALQPIEYSFDAVNSTNLTKQSWSGVWSDREQNLESTLLFGTSGTVNATQKSTSLVCVFFQDQGANLGNSFQWTSHPSGKNVFNVTLTLGSQTNCVWEKHSLSGIAVVTYQNGRDQLDMMLLDPSTGAGISYRGTYDRAP